MRALLFSESDEWAPAENCRQKVSFRWRTGGKLAPRTLPAILSWISLKCILSPEGGWPGLWREMEIGLVVASLFDGVAPESLACSIDGLLPFFMNVAAKIDGRWEWLNRLGDCEADALAGEGCVRDGRCEKFPFTAAADYFSSSRTAFRPGRAFIVTVGDGFTSCVSDWIMDSQCYELALKLLCRPVWK